MLRRTTDVACQAVKPEGLRTVRQKRAGTLEPASSTKITARQGDGCFASGLLFGSKSVAIRIVAATHGGRADARCAASQLQMEFVQLTHK
jgi:hypothetical protein